MRTIAGVSTRLVVAGEDRRPHGGVVVLVHGASAHLESFIYNLASLAEGHMVIAYDLPWHGFGSTPDRLYEIDDYVEHLLAVLDAFDVDSCSLVAHSLGAWIVARAALRSPERASRLVLIGAGGADGDMYPGRGNMAEHLLPGRTADVIGPRLKLAMGPGGAVSEELLDCRLTTYAWGDWATRVEAFTYQRVYEVWERNVVKVTDWGKITCPVLLVWGSNDRIVPLETGVRLLGWLPNAKLEIISGTGHNPQYERPADVNSLLASFLCPSSVVEESSLEQ